MSLNYVKSLQKYELGMKNLRAKIVSKALNYKGLNAVFIQNSKLIKELQTSYKLNDVF